MEKITKPNVRSIYLGKNLIAKQMQAAAGALVLEHLQYGVHTFHT